MPKINRLTPNQIFESSNLSDDLAGKSVRGGATTMGSQGVKFVLQMASTVVLARLLTPADYGLIGMVSVVVGFGAMFKDAGLSMATIQKDKISHEQISTLFWINVLISVVLGLCVLAGSPLVARFYGKPELTAVTAALSISFILSGLSIQHAALLRRHMRFGSLAVVQIASQIITLIVTILLALYGWRYWALVGGSLTTAFCIAVLTCFFCPWIPGRMQKGTGVRDMLKFGGNLMGFNMLNYFARNLDNVLIGKFYGSDSLGIYTKAYGLLMLPLSQINAPISAVAVGALSRLQNEPEKYRNYYCRTVNLIAYLTTPLIVGLAVLSEHVILLVCGTQWRDASPIFMILAIAAIGQPIANTAGWIYVSLGQTNRMFIIGSIAIPVLCLGFVCGLPWGPLGVATGYAISTHVIRYPSLWYAYRHSPIDMRDVFASVWRPGAASCVMAISMLVVRFYLVSNFSSHLFVIIACLIAAMISFTVTVLLVPNGSTEIAGIVAAIRMMRSHREPGICNSNSENA